MAILVMVSPGWTTCVRGPAAPLTVVRLAPADCGSIAELLATVLPGRVTGPLASGVFTPPPAAAPGLDTEESTSATESDAGVASPVVTGAAEAIFGVFASCALGGGEVAEELPGCCDAADIIVGTLPV